jgi:hypothetical protein
MEEIIPNHMPSPSLQHAKTLVFMHIARSQHGLLADYTLALHLGITGLIIVDVPVAPKQLRCAIAYVLDADVINKKVSRLACVGVLRRKARRYRDANTVGTAVIERLHAYLIRVTETTLYGVRGS